MNALKCCLNWRVIAGLAVIATGIGLLNPSWLAKLGPLLLYAICPLSMLVMMLTMARTQSSSPVSQPTVTRDEPLVTIPAALFAKLSNAYETPIVESPQLQLPAKAEGQAETTVQAAEATVEGYASRSMTDRVHGA